MANILSLSTKQELNKILSTVPGLGLGDILEKALQESTQEGVQELVAGSNVTINASDPKRPIVSATGDVGISSVVAGDEIDVDITDPANPVVNLSVDGIDAVSKRHTQNSDAYLTSRDVRLMHVDGDRADTYVEDGSPTKPFKTIQAAEDAIPTGSNVYGIFIKRKSANYIENLTITKAKFITGIRARINGSTILGGTSTLEIFNVDFVGTVSITNTMATNIFNSGFYGTLTQETGAGHVSFDSLCTLTPVSGSAVIMNSVNSLNLHSASVVVGDVEAIIQNAGVLTGTNFRVQNTSATKYTISSLAGQMILANSFVTNAAGTLAISGNNGATTSPNILTDVVVTGNAVFGTANTIINGIIQAVGTLTGNLVHQQSSVVYKDTIANAELGSYMDNDVVYIEEAKSLYEYQPSSGALVRDGKLILNTILAGNTRLLAIAGKYVLGQAGAANAGIIIGSTDAFGRNQIWNAQTNACMRLGSLAQDGDVLNTPSEGVIAYGTNSNGVFSQNDWAFARIKSTRLGINNCIANTQFYLFRADELGMYLKDDTNSKTFEITRSSGRTYVKGELALNTTTPRARFDMNGVNGEMLMDCVKSLTEATLVNIAELALANNSGGGISIDYTVEAIESSTNTVEMHYGKYNVIARNQNGTITYAVDHINELDLPIGSGIADVFTITPGTGKITIGLTATSGLTPTSLSLYFSTKVFGTNSVTLL